MNLPENRAPEKLYTKEEINWKNPLSRCNKEKMGKKDVPVVGRVEGWDDYDMVFIGFPIWYFAAPNIINTFVKGYDWSGKKVALFATSGGSGIGRSGPNMEALAGSGTWLDGERFSGSVSEEELQSWIDGLQ